MSDSGEISHRIVGALQDRYLVDLRLQGPREVCLCGYVLGAGNKWVLLAQTPTGGVPDGFVAIRRREIAILRRSERADAATMESTGHLLPSYGTALPDLDGTAALMRALASRFPLVGIGRDVLRPKGYAVGAFLANDGGRFWYLPVSANAVWGRKMRGIRPREISRIVVGDTYLTELALAAGPVPPASRHHPWTEPGGIQ
ncbi:hypothetical protein [Paeniglutamicibacter cryotolerans]|uniref:Uncharacterized protein n=1 Tax=Paeniglutamicibacter cryotolerans TaxID=670079 RepID=A0A839QR51_9MICC|nr:hypothetical protein [Paeniglutamicibacter cryotolerans]MBB2997145.1 hypothetical protein [Paeniglutamicibacter cryotolerans]